MRLLEHGKRDAGEAVAKPDGMGQLGKIASLADLPSDAELATLVRAAMALVDAGGTMRTAPKPKAPIAMPEDLGDALAVEPAAEAGFATFPPGAQREYIDWVVQAKQPATRARRIATTVAQSMEGKRLNWKYENC